MLSHNIHCNDFGVFYLPHLFNSAVLEAFCTKAKRGHSIFVLYQSGLTFIVDLLMNRLFIKRSTINEQQHYCNSRQLLQ